MSEAFKNQFRRRSKDFNRNCLLTFPILILFILNLIRKSLQVELNNFIKILPLRTISKQTFSAARHKLLPEAFVELNRSLMQEFYTDNEFKTLFNRRIIGVDGSTLQLPEGEKIAEKYGVCTNQTIAIPMAKISYAYDVLNNITLDAIIAPFKASERTMAMQHVKNLALSTSSAGIKDLYIHDRGYPSVALFFFYLHMKKDFLMRCSSAFSLEMNEMIKQKCRDKIIKLSIKNLTLKQKKELQNHVPNIDWNQIIQLRALVIPLNTGEQELLITTLCDQEHFKYEEFANFYFMRWGVEENYKFYKVRVEIENFSGKSPIAIEQDFHATIFTCNIRSMLATEAEEELKQQNSDKELKYEYKINKNISAATLKDEIIKVLLSKDSNLEDFCNQLKERMKLSMVPIRPGRHYTRCKKGNKKYPMNRRRSL